MSHQITELDRRLANIVRVGVIAQLDEQHALAEGGTAPRVTVDLGDCVTDWLPWITLRAGPDATWWALEPGEQVLVLAPSGELNQGFVLAGVPSDIFPAPSSTKDKHRTTFKDGTVVQYDRAAHQLLVDASASNGAVVVNVGSGSVTVNCSTATVNATTSTTVNTTDATVNASDAVTLNTPTTHLTGNLQVDGNATINGTELVKGKITGQAGMAVSGGGGATVSGSMAISGGNVTADGIGLKTHTHGGVQTGSGTTSGPSG